MYAYNIPMLLSRAFDGTEAPAGAFGAAAIETKFRQCINDQDKVLTRMDKSCVSDASGDYVWIRAEQFPYNLSLRMEFTPSVRENT
jgi:hypothetical protein